MSIPLDLCPPLFFAPIMPAVESPRLQAILLFTLDDDDNNNNDPIETVFFFSP